MDEKARSGSRGGEREARRSETRCAGRAQAAGGWGGGYLNDQVDRSIAC